MDTRVLIVALAVTCAGCEKRSQLYCGKHPEDLANCEQTDAGIDAPVMCVDNTGCPASAPYCEMSQHICVECLTSANCASDPERPNCDPVTFTCEGCLTHADCASAACLPDGKCGDDSEVIYVDPTGLDGNDCTFAKPCATIARGGELLDTTRRYLKLSGALVESATLDNKRGTILADPGTTLTGTADPALKLQSSEMRIHDLAVTCPAGPEIGGIRSEAGSTTTLSNVTVRGCAKIGVESKGGFLIVSRSTIVENADGIITDAAAGFAISNSFVVRNTNRGVALPTTTVGMNRFEFNTVAHNASGVACASVTLFPPEIPLAGNLIVANTTNTSGNVCTHANSEIADSATPYMFVNSETSPYDYHVMTGSMAIDRASFATSVIEDFDGNYRPIGQARDFGADEYKP